MDEDKSKCAGSAQENGFGSASLPRLQWPGERCSSNIMHLQKRKECNKYDLTAAQCF
jgi:hypothetical protein